MFLSRITLICAIFSVTIETCRSQRWGRGRSMRMRYQDLYDEDYYEAPESMFVRKPISRSMISARTATVFVNLRCSDHSFYYGFSVLWTWSLLAAQKKPCLYGIKFRCETQVERLLVGTAHRYVGETKYQSVGRFKLIEYWTVNEKIFKIAIHGTHRTGVWETDDYLEGAIEKHDTGCPPSTFVYYFTGFFVGDSKEPDFLYELFTRCRSINPI